MADTEYKAWRAYVRATGRTIQDFMNADADIFVATTTIGAAEDYATGGIAVKIKGNQRRNKVIAHPIISTGHTCWYDEDNEKIKVFSAGGTELANNSQALRGAVIQTIVFAR